MSATDQTAKKLFFNYSNDENDVIMMNNLCLHFAVLRDRISIWHKDKILPGAEIKKALDLNLSDSAAAIHLLSSNYESEDDCTDILEKSISLNKRNFPVLLRNFAWEQDPLLKKMEDEILPHDHRPLNSHKDADDVYTEIVQSVSDDLFNDGKKIKFNQRGYYFLLAGVALVAGFGASLWVNSLFGSIRITMLVFAMFLLTAVFILRKIIFPVSVSTSKS